jgi:hypothetical protein
MSDGGKGSNRRPTDEVAFGANYDAIFGEKKVQRGRFIWDKEKREFVPFDEYVAPVDHNAPMVMPDIQPYQSMIDGSMITSRSQHRSHLKQHGCIEIGNETKYLKAKPVTPPSGLTETLARVAYERLKY